MFPGQKGDERGRVEVAYTERKQEIVLEMTRPSTNPILSRSLVDYPRGKLVGGARWEIRFRGNDYTPALAVVTAELSR